MLNQKEKANKDIEHEQKSKKHFKNNDKLMAHQINFYADAVNTPQCSKIQKINDLINKNIKEEEYKRKAKEKEIQLSKLRRNGYENMGRHKEQIELESEEKKDSGKKSLDLGSKPSQKSYEHNLLLREEKIKKKEEYSNSLNYQIHLSKELGAKSPFSPNYDKRNYVNIYITIGTWR